MRFGFLKGGTIEKKFSLTQPHNAGSFAYLLICDGDIKDDLVDFTKGKNICNSPEVTKYIHQCQLKHIMFMDELNTTRVLPFSSSDFLNELFLLGVEADNSDSLKNTGIYDYSGDSFFDGASYESSQSIRRLKQIDHSSSFLPEEKWGNRMLDDSTNTTNSTNSTNNATGEIQALFLNKVMSSWLKYENPTDLYNMGILNKSYVQGLDTSVLRYYLTNTTNDTVPRSGNYWFILLNCDSTASVSFKFNVVNPNGEHLSAGDIGNKNVYYIMIFSWGFLFLFWSGTWLSNRVLNRRTYALQYFFFVVGLICFIFTLVEQIYWETYSETGKSPLSLKVTGAFLRGLVFSLFLGLFLLIGKGYTYINLALTNKDKREIIIFIFIRFVLSWQIEFFGYHPLIISILLLSYLIAIFIIFKDFRRNIRKINFVLDSIQLISPPNAQPIDMNLNQQDVIRLDQIGFEAEGEQNQQNGEQLLVEENAGVVQQAPIRQREPVRNFDRDIKMLKTKLQLVKLMKYFIICNILVLCLAHILCAVFFEMKPYVLNLWSQVLLATTFFIITWFFNYKHKQAFIYSNFRGFEEEDIQNNTQQRRKKKGSLVELNEFHKIAGDFVVIEDAFSSQIRLASKLTKIPQQNKPENKKDDESTKVKIKFTQRELRAQRKAWKYRVNDSYFEDHENKNKEESFKKENKFDNKCLNPDEIELEFEDQVEQNSMILDFENQDNCKLKAIEVLYPKPKQCQPVDYRKKHKNQSFYN